MDCLFCFVLEGGWEGKEGEGRVSEWMDGWEAMNWEGGGQVCLTCDCDVSVLIPSMGYGESGSWKIDVMVNDQM